MFKPSGKTFAKWSLTAAAVVFGFGALSSNAQAQFGGGFGYGYGGGFNNGFGSPYGGIGPNYGNNVFIGPPVIRVYRPSGDFNILPYPRRNYRWYPGCGFPYPGHGGLPPIYRW